LVPITTNGMVVKIQFMIRDIIDQKRSRERLFTYQQDLRSLTCQLAQTEERERRRLAVDLHDLIGQPLAVIKMKLNALKNASYSSGHATAIRDVLELLESAIHNTRSLTYDLSPPALYDLGLEAGLESLLEKFQERYAIRYEYEDDGKEKPVEDEVGILLYRCVSELLINVVKHAKAQLVKVSISREDGQVLITIEDDGIGFAIPETEGGARGFGLFSIREGLNWIGGSFAIQSEPGCGTHATLTAPLKQAENST
jgi:signal transduction histidine kinase